MGSEIDTIYQHLRFPLIALAFVCVALRPANNDRRRNPLLVAGMLCFVLGITLVAAGSQRLGLSIVLLGIVLANIAYVMAWRQGRPLW
jgi:hypothetical protein